MKKPLSCHGWAAPFGQGALRHSGKGRFCIRGQLFCIWCHEGFCISDRTGSACVAAKKEKWRIRDVRGNPWTPSCYDGCTRNGNPFPAVAHIHCGSFKDAEAVKLGIDMANAQNSDLLVLTGDLVNNEAGELNAWTGIFSALKAPFGVYSILGNHDYGDYMDWPSEAAKEANLNKLKAMQSQMGFRLLLDEHVKLEKNGQYINLAGVQNWGRRFRQYGDLDKAMEQVAENTFSILLSHDPSHWEARVLSHPKPIHLTLAGHTHGMQVGVEIPWLKWSPAKYIYRQWAGIYQQRSRYINVNRGFGFLGFSGRVGMWPEISVITLKKGKAAGGA